MKPNLALKVIPSLILIIYLLGSCKNTGNKPNKPNIVLIYLDDAGYGDFEPFGNPGYPTPNVKQLAEEGCQYSNFYVPQAICSASRAAILTGCYPERTKVFGAHGPGGKGLDPSYETMAELFKKNGYSTAVFGKWHIGDQVETHPYNQGIDESAGLMYSNDMWKYHPANPDYWSQWPLQFWERDSVIIDEVEPEHQKKLTTWFTEYAVDFINRKADSSFFLYVPHPMPHVPLYCSEKFEGKSGQGLYADVIMEIDWSVGEIMKALKKNGIEENTIVIFSSDNGPWDVFGNHAGVTPFRGAKRTSFDGGIRSACIIKYPKEIQAGSKNNKTFFSIDLLPSLASLTNSQLPDYEIDGKDIWGIISNEKNAKNPHNHYFFTNEKDLEGVLTADGKWKLHLPHEYYKIIEEGNDGDYAVCKTLQLDTSLFDMVNDPYETKNVINEHPEVVDSLLGVLEKHKERFFN